MFSSMKMEECMEYKLSDIFRVKPVAKNIVLGSPETQGQAVFAVWCVFPKKHTNAVNAVKV